MPEPSPAGQEAFAAGMARFMWYVGRLKRAIRTGWVLRGVRNVESVSDHCWRMSVMSYFADGWGISRDYAMRMALVHDLAEALVGDIPREDTTILPEDKHVAEKNALLKMLEPLRGVADDIADQIFNIWLEYDAGESPTALFVKDMDKLEMIMQAVEYEAEDAAAREADPSLPGPPLDLSCFQEAIKRLKHPLSTVVAGQILALSGQPLPVVPKHH